MLELADAVIVGGGIMGTALAAALSRRLSRVLLLDSERCGAKATAGGFAWVNASSKWQDETYHRLNADACRYHISQAAEWGSVRIGWHGGGSLWWSDRPGSAPVNLRERAILLQSWGYPVTLLNHPELAALEPHLSFAEDSIGLFAPSEGWIETARLIRFLIEQARERRADISEFTRVTGFTRDHTGGIATVETTRGRVSTGVLVLAAGTETSDLASLVLGAATSKQGFTMQQSPGLLLETEPLTGPATIHRVCYPPDEAGLHLRPTPQGGLLVGADDTDALCRLSEGSVRTTASTNLDWDLSGEDIPSAETRLRERAARLIPEIHDIEARLRHCVRPIPPDGLPVIGPLPDVRNVYLLCSHSGVTLGLYAGHLLADEIITGRQSSQLSPYRPARFQRTGG